MTQYKSSKLFNLDDRKRQTGKAITEVDVFQWKSTLLEELRKNAQFTDHLKPTATWKSPKVNHRGFDGADAEKVSKQVDDLLTKIASYSPSCLVRAISKRTTCLEDIWTLVRDWAGIQTTGSRHLDYFRVKRSWKTDGDETKQEFFYRLKDSMEDTLLSRNDNIQEDGQNIVADEDMTPCLNSIIVMDWVDAIGGAPLVEHIHRVYAKDLESVTLGSLQSRISKNMDSLLHEIEEQQQQQLSHINRVEYGNQAPSTPPYRSFNRGGPGKSKFQPRTPRQIPPNFAPPRRPMPSNMSPVPSTPSRSIYCKLCRTNTNHYISTCPNLTPTDRSQIAKARLASSNQEDQLGIEYECVEDDEFQQYEEEEEVDNPAAAQD